jgi:signal transduction histidine kinase/DNA-binding response OmpR family regulator/HPt (histidine-containing phosphotransfer) domain-containing protein
MKRNFLISAVAIAVVAWFVVYFRAVPLQRVYLFTPSLMFATMLGEAAVGILAWVLLQRTRARAYFPLALTSFACGMFNFAGFILVPLPGNIGALVGIDQRAAPWLNCGWLIVFAIGSAWYAADRVRSVSLTLVQTRRILVYWLPAALVLIAAAIVGLIEAVPNLPPIFHPNDVSGYRSSGIGYVALVCLAAALAVNGVMRRDRPDRIANAVTLAVFCALAGAMAMLASNHRVDLSWIAMRLFYFASALLILAGITRQLFDRLNDNLRLETELLRAEASAFEQNAAVEASIVKSRFVAAISHELRTPLGGIMGMAELLERTHLTERQRACTAAIRTSADTLLRIVNDLLDFSRIDAGMLQLEDVPFELNRLVDDVVVLFREQARQKGVALSAFVSPSVPGTLSGDPTRIKQVLQNLINNAVRFTPEGSIRVEVAHERWAGGTPMLAFSVRDTGIGIAESAHERIFEAFTQEDASTARRFGGTGLGLAIARHLVQLMGGRIWLRSTVGVGSTFTFTVPLRTVEDPVDSSMPLRDMRILVVERDPAIRDLLQRYVAGWEMLAQTVGSADEALALVARHVDGDRRCAVLLVGPGLSPDEAIALADALRESPMMAEADRIYIGNEDACVSGPLRQSKLFNTITRHLIERKDEVLSCFAPRRPRRERILVAEDNEINQTLLVAQLEHLGFAATLASDGGAAIEAADAQHFDLIFMDCQMPGVDGFEAARHIRAGNSSNRETPIIAVTANVLPGYREICVAAGMNDYLAKPALIEPLTRIVDHWLPLTGEPPAPAPTAITPIAPIASPVDVVAAPKVDIRKRLREIFRGDDARVEATITMALSSLRDGTIALRSSMDQRDANGASRTAHKLKGIAMEIGLVEIADLARVLEDRLKVDDWPAAESTLLRFVEAVAVEAGQSESTMQ